MQLGRAPLAFLALAVAACSGGGAGGLAPGDAPPAATLSLAAHVPAGADELVCTYVTLSDAAAFVEGFSHAAGFGFHHVYVYATDLAAMPAGGAGPVDCRADPSNPMAHARGSVYASEAARDHLALPAGVGLPIAAGAPLLVQVHYVNAGGSDLDVSGSLDVSSVATDPGTHAGAFFFYDPFIDVGAGQVAQASMRCAVPADVTVLTTVGAGRSHSIGFEAFLDPPSSVAGDPYYHAPGWSDPLPLAATLPIAQGSHLRFACTFDNSDGSTELLQGASPYASEECALSGLYYPDQGEDFSACRVEPDTFGTGAATCSATRSCVEACGASSSPPPDLGLGGEPAIDPCWQRCIVASCPDASGPLFALRTCMQTRCSTACTGPSGSGSTECTTCLDAQCQSEGAACAASACAR